MKQNGSGSNGRVLQGYIYSSFGDLKYLKHAVTSVITLRRYDKKRPVALFCTEEHRDHLRKHNLEGIFDQVSPLKSEHASIVGFKHNLHHYMPFACNLFLDSDIIWCKSPERLWSSLTAHPVTVTGTQMSDNFFGAPKHVGVIKDILFKNRQRTLDRFGLTYLSRVQTGMIYAEDRQLVRKLCETAATFLSRIGETHFQSRLLESGRDEESCEWSLAMAMSKLDIPVYPWLQGQTSPQLDFIDSYTSYDDGFYNVECLYYSDTFVYNLRGLKTGWLRKFLISLFSVIPGKGDHLKVTPYCLHFGWYHQKRPFLEFSDKVWDSLTEGKDVMNRLIFQQEEREAEQQGV